MAEPQNEAHTAAYYRFYLRATSVWGLQAHILTKLTDLHLETIDFRSNIEKGEVISSFINLHILKINSN